MTFIDEMENLMINDKYGILCFVKEINKNEVLSKVYCLKLRNQDDLMILCENHLNVLILPISKYDCSKYDCFIFNFISNFISEFYIFTSFSQ